MDTTHKRPWYRLHWGTVLATVLVGWGWVESALPNWEGERWPPHTVGWPLIFLRGPDFHEASLAVDIGLILVCLAAVAAVLERLGSLRGQFSLATLASVVTAVAAVLAFQEWDYRQYPAWYVGKYLPLGLFRWSDGFHIYLAIGCAAFLASRLGLLLVSRSFALLRPPAPAEVDADGSPTQ